MTTYLEGGKDNKPGVILFVVVVLVWAIFHFSCVSRHVTKSFSDSTVVEKKAEAHKVDSTVNKESEYERETVIEFDTTAHDLPHARYVNNGHWFLQTNGSIDSSIYEYIGTINTEPISRPIRITIKEKGKAAEQINLSKTEEKKEEKTVEVKKKDVEKTSKSFSWWWLLLLLIPIYYLRKHIVSFLKFSL